MTNPLSRARMCQGQQIFGEAGHTMSILADNLEKLAGMVIFGELSSRVSA